MFVEERRGQQGRQCQALGKPENQLWLVVATGKNM